MGMTPLPPDPPEWGIDIPGIFPPGQTPKYIYANFWGITRRAGTEDEGDYNGTFKLTQHPVITNSYTYTTGPQIIGVIFSSEWTRIDFMTASTVTIFWQVVYAPGVTFFTNNLTADPPVSNYYGGKCVLSWIHGGDESIEDAGEQFGIELSNDLYGQAFPNSEEYTIFGFADDDARIKMRIKKEL